MEYVFYVELLDEVSRKCSLALVVVRRRELKEARRLVLEIVLNLRAGQLNLSTNKLS